MKVLSHSQICPNRSSVQPSSRTRLRIQCCAILLGKGELVFIGQCEASRYGSTSSENTRSFFFPRVLRNLSLSLTRLSIVDVRVMWRRIF